jgi:hypothetical protein
MTCCSDSSSTLRPGKLSDYVIAFRSCASGLTLYLLRRGMRLRPRSPTSRWASFAPPTWWRRGLQPPLAMLLVDAEATHLPPIRRRLNGASRPDRLEHRWLLLPESGHSGRRYAASSCRHDDQGPRARRSPALRRVLTSCPDRPPKKKGWGVPPALSTAPRPSSAFACPFIAPQNLAARPPSPRGRRPAEGGAVCPVRERKQWYQGTSER